MGINYLMGWLIRGLGRVSCKENSLTNNDIFVIQYACRITICFSLVSVSYIHVLLQQTASYHSVYGQVVSKEIFQSDHPFLEWHITMPPRTLAITPPPGNCISRVLLYIFNAWCFRIWVTYGLAHSFHFMRWSSTPSVYNADPCVQTCVCYNPQVIALDQINANLVLKLHQNLIMNIKRIN